RPVKAKKGGGGGITKVCQLSPQLDKFIGTSQIARTEKGLQDPKDGRKILCDEFAAFLVKCISMLLQMNKALSKHIWSLADGGDGTFLFIESCMEDDYEGESEYEIRSLRKRKKKKLVLSISLSSLYCPAMDALVKFFGDGESSLSSRSDVVQRLWESIKQNELQVYHLLSTLVYF
ncbi:unnamed protein product, partial [Brassica oleracea]